MANLLVIDDEPNVRYSLEKGLQHAGLRVSGVGTAREGIERVRVDPPDAIILDVRLPDMSGLAAYEQIRQLDPRLPVIIVTAHATTETAIEATKLGAFDYQLKPVDLHKLREVVERAVELSRLSRVPALLDHEAPAETAGDRIVGRSPAMQEVYKAIGRVAPQDVTVLILGESGTGKELVARSIYQHSRRSRGPFLTINCAAIPESLLESELFGHERGAFTGADRRRIGRFEQAHGGTIFMDEIGDMTYGTQAKLLRLLQEQQFERVGGDASIRTDVRVIAATNQDLPAMVATQRFRQDLFYRLNVFAIRLPALRDRPNDVPLLINYFLRQYNRELGRHVHSVAPDTQRLLEKYSWPGNVRELQSTIKYALLHAAGDGLTVDNLPETLRFPVGSTTRPGSPSGNLDVTAYLQHLLNEGEPEIYSKVHAAVDRLLLEEVLRHTKGNQVLAAEVLGVSRNTLRARLRQFNLAVEKQLQTDQEREGG